MSKKRKSSTRSMSTCKSFLIDVCKESSLHGLNHFTRPNRSTLEQVVWSVIVTSAILGTLYTGWHVWNNYVTSGPVTVVETTYFKYAQVSFPSVVICDVSRVDWKRVLALDYAKMVSTDQRVDMDQVRQTIQALLQGLSVITYGDFDEFNRLRQFENSTIPLLNKVNITQLLLQVMRPCPEVFIGECYWRYERLNCCDIFELQKTEFGFCFSYNSDFSEVSMGPSQLGETGLDSFWEDSRGVWRPKRTSTRGQFSGLRVRVSTPPLEELPPLVDARPGVKVLIGEPRAFTFGTDMIVSSGSFGDINVWGDRVYSRPRLRSMTLDRRKCLFMDEARALGYPECTIEQLLCLNKHNLAFNQIMPSNVDRIFFISNDSSTEILTCDCDLDCDHQMYIAEVTVAETSVVWRNCRSVCGSFSSQWCRDCLFPHSTIVSLLARSEEQDP
uniref:Pickpocket protein 19 n=1 Tax=Cacopsylla melanoneura TaxID=428564 RepID=A0A8D9E627_9HEMI